MSDHASPRNPNRSLGTAIRERVAFQIFDGPNLVVPYAAIVAEFAEPPSSASPSDQLKQQLNELFPRSEQLAAALADNELQFPALVTALTNAWQERLWPMTPPAHTACLEAGRHQIAVGFYDSEVTTNVVRAAIGIAETIFGHASGAAADTQNIFRTIREIYSKVPRRHLSDVTLRLFRAANTLKIPFYPVSKDAGICVYGQGARGLHGREAIDHQDSFTGYALSSDKAYASQFLRRLGFPTAEHQIAASAAAARQIARNLGYPLVVKPTNRGGGTAVAVGITTDNELDAAFERAGAGSRGGTRQGRVMIERYVRGDDHRLSVFGGKLMRVGRLLPPQIVGDGKRTVAELIEAENLRRKDEIATNPFLRPLAIDGDMTALLRKQGFAPSDQPPQALELRLRNTSNLHTGGTLEDMTASIHPDNVVMAETIAKNFHLSAIGIDFITPDIGKAWHQVECAIIEVNFNPGAFVDSLMEKILLDRFPEGNDGRIPSILIVGGGAEIIAGVVHHVQASGKHIGQTSSGVTSLAGQPRLLGSADLPTRILSLLLDSTCEILVVSCTPEELAEHGLPHTRYDIALMAASDPPPEAIYRLIENNSSQILEQASMKVIEDATLSSIMTLVRSS